jgi:hypothetical protein
MGRALRWVGAGVYAIAWFLPTTADEHMAATLRELGTGHAAEHGGLPGWDSIRFAWRLLTEERAHGLTIRVLGATGLTNALMMFALIVGIRQPRSVRLAATMFGCAALNLSWIYLGDARWIQAYGIGYYTWIASYIIVGVSFLTPLSSAVSDAEQPSVALGDGS